MLQASASALTNNCIRGAIVANYSAILQDESVQRRFWSYVDQRDADECWLWTGNVKDSGYGTLHVGGSTITSHRISWIIANNQPIPEGYCVCHSCDNPPCVNPSHLWVGTNQDNVTDMMRKGRHIRGWRDESKTMHPVGEKHPCAKLNNEQVFEIRRRLKSGDNGAVLAAEFGVSRKTISAIGRRYRWRHV